MNKQEQELYDYIIEATNGDTHLITEGMRERLLHPSICVLDAVYSAQLPYVRFDDHESGKGLLHNYFNYVERTRNINIRPSRGAYLQEDQTEDTLRDLQDLITAVGAENFGPEVMGDSGGYKMPGTRILKSVGCFNLTNYLLAVDPQTSTHAGLEDYANRVNLDSEPWLDHKLRGIGPKTFRYLCMLAGDDDGVKPDVWIRRLVTLIIGGGRYSDEYIIDLVVTVARALRVTPKSLDNWLWRHAKTHSKKIRQGFLPEL